MMKVCDYAVKIFLIYVSRKLERGEVTFMTYNQERKQ
jgi:hypothetical protein